MRSVGNVSRITTVAASHPLCGTLQARKGEASGEQGPGPVTLAYRRRTASALACHPFDAFAGEAALPTLASRIFVDSFNPHVPFFAPWAPTRPASQAWTASTIPRLIEARDPLWTASEMMPRIPGLVLSRGGDAGLRLRRRARIDAGGGRLVDPRVLSEAASFSTATPEVVRTRPGDPARPSDDSSKLVPCLKPRPRDVRETRLNRRINPSVGGTSRKSINSRDWRRMDRSIILHSQRTEMLRPERLSKVEQERARACLHFERRLRMSGIVGLNPDRQHDTLRPRALASRMSKLAARIFAPSDSGDLQARVHALYQQSVAVRRLLQLAHSQQTLAEQRAGSFASARLEARAHRSVTEVVLFLAARTHADQVASMMGMHHLHDWRNELPEEMRRQTQLLFVEVARRFRPDPATWLRKRMHRLDRDSFLRLAGLMISTFSQGGQVDTAESLFGVLRENGFLADAHEAGIGLEPRLAMAVARLAEAFLALDRFEKADDIIQFGRPAEQSGRVRQTWVAIRLSIAAELGRVSEVDALFAERAADPQPAANTIGLNRTQARLQRLASWQGSLKITARAAANDLLGAREVFDTALSDILARTKSSDAAVRLLYVRMIQVYAGFGNLDAAHRLLQNYIQRKHSLEPILFNPLLHGYARVGKLAGARATWNQMIQLGVQPDLQSYRNVAQLYANRRDADGALDVLQDSRAAGLSPDRMMWNTVMDAFVEAGKHEAALKAFRFLERQTRPNLRPNVTTYNIRLKALTRAGKSATSVLTAFNQFFPDRPGATRPDAHSYALLLQALTDADKLDEARSIFGRVTSGQICVQPNTYLYGVMIGACVRHRRNLEAIDYFRDLRARGFRPTAVICAMVISAYGQDRQDLPVAKELTDVFIPELENLQLQASRHLDPVTSRGEHVDLLNRSLIYSFVRHSEPERAAEVFRSLLTRQPSVSMPIYSMLLSGYRHARNPGAVKAIWDLAFEKAIADSKAATGGSRQKIVANPYVLTLPLSHFVDAMAETGHFDDVAGVWEKVKEAGFRMNSHSWNTLARANALAENEAEAWRIAEEILCGSKPGTLSTPAAPKSDPDDIGCDIRSRPGSASPKPIIARHERPRSEDPEACEDRLALAIKEAEVASGWRRSSKERTRDIAPPRGHPANLIRKVLFNESLRYWRPENRLLVPLEQFVRRRLESIRNSAATLVDCMDDSAQAISTFHAAYPNTMSSVYSTLWFRFDHFPLKLPRPYKSVEAHSDRNWRLKAGREALLRQQFIDAVETPHLTRTVTAEQWEEHDRINQLRSRIRRQQVGFIRATKDPVDRKTWDKGPKPRKV